MFKQRLLLLLIVIISTISCSDTRNKLTPLLSDATILAFGDSLTFGTGTSNEKNYPSYLAKLTNLNVINAGIPGELSSKGLERLPALLEQHKPNLLILIHGGNDILRKHSHTELKHNLLQMILESQQRGIEVVLLGVPEPGIFLKSAKVYIEIENEIEIPVELSLLADILGNQSLKADMTHPNAEGYEALAEGIFNFLKENGALTH